jgi:hypothetical protein
MTLLVFKKYIDNDILKIFGDFVQNVSGSGNDCQTEDLAVVCLIKAVFTDVSDKIDYKVREIKIAVTDFNVQFLCPSGPAVESQPIQLFSSSTRA